MEIVVPDPSVILLIGPSGSGKSTFARKHFRPTEILSSDYCRALVSDDENDQSATQAAFEVLRFILWRRLRRRRFTVIDATNVQAHARRPLIAISREHRMPVTGLVFDLPHAVCAGRNEIRLDRGLARETLESQAAQLRNSLPKLLEEGFHSIHTFKAVNELDQVVVRRSVNLNGRDCG